MIYKKSEFEKLKKTFYSEVICFKLGLPVRKLKQNVIISELF